MSWGRRGLWPRAAVRIKALDADCDRPANAEQGEQKRGDATDVIIVHHLVRTFCAGRILC